MTPREEAEALVHYLDAIPQDVTVEEFNAAANAIERTIREQAARVCEEHALTAEAASSRESLHSLRRAWGDFRIAAIEIAKQIRALASTTSGEGK